MRTGDNKQQQYAYNDTHRTDPYIVHRPIYSAWMCVWFLLYSYEMKRVFVWNSMWFDGKQHNEVRCLVWNTKIAFFIVVAVVSCCFCWCLCVAQFRCRCFDHFRILPIQALQSELLILRLRNTTPCILHKILCVFDSSEQYPKINNIKWLCATSLIRMPLRDFRMQIRNHAQKKNERIYCCCFSISWVQSAFFFISFMV